MAKRNVNATPPAYAWPEAPIDKSGLDPKKLEAWWKLLKKKQHQLHLCDAQRQSRF